MKLSNYINEEFIFVDIEAESKEEMIIEILKKCAEKDGNLKESFESIKENIIKKDKIISAAMGNGVAIPNVREEKYNDFLIAVGVAKKPIICDTIYNEKDNVKYFFLIISNLSKNNIILKNIARVQKIFRDTEFNKEIYEENIGENEIVKIIKKYEKESEDGLEAQDIMRIDIKPLSLKDKMYKAAKMFVEESIDGIPVIDKDGNFAGDITEEDIISFGLPKYTEYLNDLNFLRSSEQFEKYFKDEKNIEISEIYNKKPAIKVSKNTSVAEITFLMVHNNISRVYVVEDGKYYGLIMRNYIIKRVLNI